MSDLLSDYTSSREVHRPPIKWIAVSATVRHPKRDWPGFRSPPTVPIEKRTSRVGCYESAENRGKSVTLASSTCVFLGKPAIA
jgi:hypothetical protein